MQLFYRPVTRKRVAILLLLLTVSEIGFPSVSYALTSGPSQPEFSSFESVSTNKLVDEFSGDFTYNIPVINIPGPQGSDYPLSLSYHSGATPEEEASWVGYGWTLNPGAINRNARGFPDDFNNAPVTYWNKMPANWTVTAGGGVGTELFGKDLLGVSASLAVRYNNYQGYGYNLGAGLSLGKGLVSLGASISDGQSSFSASVNPVTTTTSLKSLKAGGEMHRNYTMPSGHRISLLGGSNSLITYSDINRSDHVANYQGASVNVSAGLEINPLFFPIGGSGNVFGSYTRQQNFDKEDLNAYGYMYSKEAGATTKADNTIEDYFVEKETPYNKRDNFLGIPFNNADIFSVSGEGIGGGFRLYHEEIGEFIPNDKTSEIYIGNVSPEGAIGTTTGLGFDFGAGYHRFTEGPWEGKNLRQQFSGANNGDDKAFFRFTNDLGGQSSIVVSDEPVSARTNLGALTKTDLQLQLNQTAAHGRSSFIGYHTAGDIYNKATRVLRRAKGFSHRQEFQNSVGQVVPYGLPVNYDELTASSICEMTVTTAAGGRYLYGLPVLAKEEGNLQYGIRGDQLNNNYTVSTNKSEAQMDVKVGEQRSAAYATSFPLTEIQTPDYVDRTLNGPTADDLGGYTRFNYIKVYGGGTAANGWYNWRAPYSGLLYSPRSLSDKSDDLGTVSYGKKEVVYLQSVQTKTHTAIFVLGPRDDSRDAGEEYPSSGQMPRARLGTENPDDKKSLKKLIRIDLYANGDVEQVLDPATNQQVIKAKSEAKPIKSVHFAYSNDLFKATSPDGLPNALLTTGGTRQGKLTLTRIWFEYQGIPTKISPYTFSYNYPDRYSDYPARYQSGAAQSVTTTSDGLTTAVGSDYYDMLSLGAQNPAYTSFCLDAWGNFRNNGETRAKNMQSWLDQRDLDDPDTDKADWDPAAWQLKGITLPTGGQIQVQYEQDDYAFVQDKPVHAMARLLPGGSDNLFYLDLGSLGLNTTAEQDSTIAALKRQYILKDNRKIFFKFLYSLVGNTNPTLKPLSANSEYISGYATVSEVGRENGTQKVYVKLGGPGYTLPRDVCKNFLQTQRAGMLDGNSFQDSQNSAISIVRNLLSWIRTVALPTTQCVTMNPDLSYFRIPLVKPKKGGGLRVKRLLTFDKTGLDGQAVLYGSEYIYRLRLDDGTIISSGVATTEPSQMREENILVDYLPRQNQSLLSRVVSGLDRKQSEGMLGESLLPAPSVGYSQVIVRNIHSGRTTPGFSISKFATARQYPMQVKYSAMQTLPKFQLAYTVFTMSQINNTYATQGYSFLLNSMHGQPKSQATYPGDYPGISTTMLPSPTSKQQYTYYEPATVANQEAVKASEAIPIVSEQSSITSDSHPGREVDISIAQKAVKDNLFDVNFEVDGQVSLFFFPIPWPTVVPLVSTSKSELYTHVTSKVIRYPAVIKRIETVQDGITHTTENIAFDRLSGQAVQTKETDEFKGGYVQEKTQAAWVRPEFGPKWERENRFISSAPNAMTITSGSNGEIWLTFTGSTCDGLTKITRGDQLGIVVASAQNSPGNDGDNTIYFADAPDFSNKRVRIYPVGLPFTTANPFPLNILGKTATSVQILTSGRHNLLTAAAGATTYHNTDYRAVAPFITSTKYASSAFTSAINGWLLNNTKQNDSFQAAGPFQHMNVSAYANKLPVGCKQDPSDVTVSNVILAKQIINGQNRISLVSFTILCDGANTAVAIQN
ncbi:MAG: hypothetical protein EOO61_00800 [Hymenobacter sp.]|nr:MAG: hypothetical protein EOO61_00800 [Hymenobacter sp.]